MSRTGSLLLGMALVAGGLSIAMPPAAAGSTGITVYTWTDASGTTHFSDTPRHKGAVKQLSLPNPPPPDQTALAANKAWLRQLNRTSEADLAQAAARRRAERQREAAVAEQHATLEEAPVRYIPVFFPARRHRHWHRRHHRDHDDHRFPSARFPFNALPSSFPDPLASSFPPGLPSSFPEEPSSRPGHH